MFSHERSHIWLDYQPLFKKWAHAHPISEKKAGPEGAAEIKPGHIIISLFLNYDNFYAALYCHLVSRVSPLPIPPRGDGKRRGPGNEFASYCSPLWDRLTLIQAKDEF